MKTRRFSHGLMLTLATALFVACGGEQPKPESPPAPTPAAPEAPAAPSADPATAGPAASSAPAEPPKKAEAPKPNKEKVVGKWTQDFSGDVKTAAEEDAKKKAGKDEKKLADLLKKAEKTTNKHWVENT